MLIASSSTGDTDIATDYEYLEQGMMIGSPLEKIAVPVE
jgi:hypothetical protein